MKFYLKNYFKFLKKNNNNILLNSLFFLANILAIIFVIQGIYFYYQEKIKIINNNYQKVCSVEKKDGYYFFDQIKINQKKCIELKNTILILQEREKFFISVFLLFYSVLLFILGVYQNKVYLIFLAIVLNFSVIIRVVFYELWQMQTMHRFLLSLNTILVSYLNASFFREYKKLKLGKYFLEPKKISFLFIFIINILIIISLSQEIFLYYNYQIELLREEFYQICDHYESQGCLNIKFHIQDLIKQKNIILTFFWFLYCFFLFLYFSLKYKNKKY